MAQFRWKYMDLGDTFDNVFALTYFVAMYVCTWRSEGHWRELVLSSYHVG